MNRFSVIVLDDEISVSLFILKIFEMEMPEIDVIASLSNGEEAIELLKSGVSADIIITDIHMPKKNGIELVQYVRETGLNRKGEKSLATTSVYATNAPSAVFSSKKASM